MQRLIRSLLIVIGITLLTVRPTLAAHPSVIANTYQQTLPKFEAFLANINELDSLLWSATEFSEQQIWEMILHSALAAKNIQLEAVAHQQLVRLGITEGELRTLYELNPEQLNAKQIATYVYAQRSGVLPTRVNANDIIELRKHFGHKALVDLKLINAYVNMFSIHYASGYVDVDTNKSYPDLTPNLQALTQEKDNTATGWEDRHFFESSALSPEFTTPLFEMDVVTLLDRHSFNEQEIWEMFVIGQKASDCKHCVTHGAFGMHLAYAEPKEIVNAYNYDGSGDYSDREKARFDFIRATMVLPSQVTQAHLAALEQHYTEQEIQHIVALTAFMGLLSSYMQVTAVITDAESANFTTNLLGPEGFELGRHVGPVEQQRAIHPTTMYRLSEHSGANQDMHRVMLWGGHVVIDIWSREKFTFISGPALHAISQIIIILALLIGYRKVTAK